MGVSSQVLQSCTKMKLLILTVLATIANGNPAKIARQLQCPVNSAVSCNSNEVLCTGSVVDGCPRADTCVPMSTPNPDGDGECMAVCDATCNSNEMICSGSIVNGCMTATTCQQMTTPNMNGDGECNAYCPAYVTLMRGYALDL